MADLAFVRRVRAERPGVHERAHVGGWQTCDPADA
jgi:hypothetical protein